MLTDAARELVGRRDRERQERIDGSRPLFDSAWTKGDYRLAEPGCEVWARTEGDLSAVRMTADGDARGGIILEITSGVDTGTGEIVRSFRTFDYTVPDGQLWQAFTVLTEAQVDPDSFTVARVDRIRGQYRRLCRVVGGRRGVATPAEVQMVVDAFRLASIVGQRVRP